MTQDLPWDYLDPTSVYPPWWNYPSASATAQTRGAKLTCVLRTIRIQTRR